RGREAVSTRRVAVILGQERQHFLDHRGIDFGSSVVIEIDDFDFGHCRHCNRWSDGTTTVMELSLVRYSTNPLFHDFDLGVGEPATARDHGLSPGKTNRRNGSRTWP